MSRSGTQRRVLRLDDWQAEGTRLFGAHGRDWAFRCPACGGTQTAADFVALDMTPDEAMSRVDFSCIGRWQTQRGCDWTLGGLLQIHRLEVEEPGGTRLRVFEFATPENAPGPDFKPLGKLRGRHE